MDRDYCLIMTRRRFNVLPSAINADQIILSGDEALHLRNVLRLKPGDEVFVFDGTGREFHCRIEKSTKESTLLRLISEVSPAQPESPLDLTLAVALLKGDKFDLVVQKATELGVSRIQPLQTERADQKLRNDKDSEKRVVRWQRIALEAAKQSGRARVPEVALPQIASELFKHSSCTHNLHLLFSERDGIAMADTFDEEPANSLSVVAAVGSEGGWADSELDLARANGWKIITLGGRILRAETAAIMATGLLQHRLGDLT